MSRRPETIIRAFGMSSFQIQDDLKKLSKDTGFELSQEFFALRNRKLEGYAQFEKSIRSDASEMSEYYEIFFCLENSIRKVVSEILFESEGADWWLSSRISFGIKNEVKNRKKKEIDSGVSIRSDKEIDYTTFGELQNIITDNWDLFDPVMSSKSAVARVLNVLNVIRGPIAHCVSYSDSEKDRLKLAVADWFRIIS